MIADWPPTLPKDKQHELKEIAIDWATQNGLIIRSVTNENPTAIHAPFALFPSPFPKSGYDFANQIQPLFNVLVDRVARDHEFLASVMDTLSKADEFTSKVYKIYLENLNHPQKVSCGIHRSDYLLHYEDGVPTIKQVELNTIASSFSSLSAKTYHLHRYLSNRTSFFNELSPGTKDIHSGALPFNQSGNSIAKALANAHFLYGNNKAVVMMIVQPGENNLFDQRWIEQALFENHGVKLIRRSLAQVQKSATLVGEKKTLDVDGFEISVVYYRSGYAPTDYPSENEWKARALIEQSFAVKCPNAAYHLVGAKKIQQVLAEPGRLEKYLSKEDAEAVRLSFTGLYPMDQSKEGIQAYKQAVEDPSRYVLKPQREGGGNNYYGEDIKTQLLRMTPEERNGFILMDLIKPPPLKNIMVRKGQTIESDVISELGIYGIWVSKGDVCLLNECGGHLLRTKSSQSNEGGVAAGFAVLDSPFLI